MKKLKTFVFGLLALISGGTFLYRSFMFYFVRKQGPTGEYFDGFGNILIETPPILHLLYVQDSLWAGGVIFFTEVFIGFTLLGITYLFINLSASPFVYH